MDDLISRQAAIDTALRAINDLQAKDPLRDEYIIFEMEEIPSAVRRGRWGRWAPEFNGKYKGGAYWFHCSRCGRIVPDVRNGGWNYCPNCGAKMEV